MSGIDADRTRALHAPAAKAAVPEVLLQVAFRSDRGLVRENNEDSFLVADLTVRERPDGDSTAGISRVGVKGVLLAVSDGMGGQEAGEVASRLAVENLRDVLREEWGVRTERDAVAELRNDLRTAVDRANRAVLQHVEQNPARAGMGATLTAAVVFGRTLVIAHVGDSRCYLLREGFLKALTSDQSLAEELVRRGVVERDTPAYEARKSVLTRVVGQSGPLVADSETLELAKGDRLLLCSDGLHGPVEDSTIRDVLAGADDPDCAVEGLIAEAKRRGAPDNVTCVAAWVSGDGLDEADDLDRGGTTVSVRLDARSLAAAADATLALAESRRDATGEFDAGKVREDETLRGPLAPPAPAAGTLAAPPAPSPGVGLPPGARQVPGDPPAPAEKRPPPAPVRPASDPVGTAPEIRLEHWSPKVKSEVVPLGSAEVVVGRDRGELKYPDDNYLSKKHARFYRDGDGRLCVEDLGTLNGTFLKLREPFKLEHRDTLLLGRHVFRFELMKYEEKDDRTIEGDPLTRVQGVQGSAPRARIVKRQEEGFCGMPFFFGTSKYVLGRTDGTHNFGRDDRMSRRHTAIQYRDGDYWIEDLGSQNGTFVRLRGPRVLESGDVVLMGDQYFRLP